MQITQIHILQLHQPKPLLQLEHRILPDIIHNLGRNKKFLPRNPALADDRLDGLAEGELVVVVAGCVDVTVT